MIHGEPIEGLVRELNDLTETALLRARLEPPDLRRVLAFTAKVSQVADQAFQDVLAVLIEVKYLAASDLRPDRIRDVRKQVELLTARSRFRDAEEICSRLHHLGDQYQSQIAPLLAGVTDTHSWQGVFGLINEHEGRLIMLVHQTVSDLGRRLARVNVDSLASLVHYADERIGAVRRGIDELRSLSNRILGLSGVPGLLELIETGGPQRPSAVFFNQGGLRMSGDTYTVGQAGAVGPGSSAQNISFQQLWQQNAGTVDLRQLGDELARLRSAMRSEATLPEHDEALGAVAAAEKEAKAGNGPKVLEHLRSAGKWAFDTATKIGVTVAAGAIKTGLGL